MPTLCRMAVRDERELDCLLPLAAFQWSVCARDDELVLFQTFFSSIDPVNHKVTRN